MVGYGVGEVKPMNRQRIKHGAFSSTGNGVRIDDNCSLHRSLVTMGPVVRQLVDLPVHRRLALWNIVSVEKLDLGQFSIPRGEPQSTRSRGQQSALR